MKYRVTTLPSTEKALKFKVQSQEGKEEAFFSFSRPLIEVWGNPLEAKLKEVMIAYIKQNGWSKQPVALDPANSAKNPNKFIQSLPQKKKSK